jgi:hypothetical protein
VHHVQAMQGGLRTVWRHLLSLAIVLQLVFKLEFKMERMLPGWHETCFAPEHAGT